ncbi:MAG: hypothetical protein HYS12_26880 [Planctomycetes bacterium]|nr:hypothetical protein [Planctomycetota bacterium]
MTDLLTLRRFLQHLEELTAVRRVQRGQPPLERAGEATGFPVRQSCLISGKRAACPESRLEKLVARQSQ